MVLVLTLTDEDASELYLLPKNETDLKKLYKNKGRLMLEYKKVCKKANLVEAMGYFGSLVGNMCHRLFKPETLDL